MKVLHTSDWHLGRTLYGKKRYEEFIAFLDWLVETINQESIDVLLIAGDVFDTSTPSNRAQQLYYRFLYRVAASCCRHIVIIAGNHDSPSFLEAPKELLKALCVYVVGAVSDSLEDELVILKKDDIPEAIICAVPYLRDKDIRTSEAGESIDDKNAKLVAGLKNHYKNVCDLAQKKRESFESAINKSIPIIAMGHLFTDGGKTFEGDGVRELYVGSLAHVSADIFPLYLDYVALGHLHVPQTVGGREFVRYSGSPLPMGYGEALHTKIVVTVDFSEKPYSVKEIDVPCFQALERIEGSLNEISERIETLKSSGSKAWLEIEFTGKEVVSSLRKTLEEALDGADMEVRRIKNRRVMSKVMKKVVVEEALSDLNIEDVFKRCLDQFDVQEDERRELNNCYREVIKDIQEQDVNAE